LSELTTGGKGSAVDERSAGGTQSIRRVAEVLEIVARGASAGVSVAEIAHALSLTRSTAHRVVKAMRDVGFLQRAEETDRYKVGQLMWELGLSSEGDLPDSIPWRHAVDKVAARTGQTCYLLTRSGLEAICSYKMEARGVLRAIPVEVGQRRVLGVGTGGIALLSGFEPSEIQRITATLSDAYAPYPKLSAENVYEMARDAREQNGVVSRGNVLSGVLGVGCLVPCAENHPKYAITIAAPAAAVHQSEVPEILDIIRQEIGRAQTAQRGVA